MRTFGKIPIRISESKKVTLQPVAHASSRPAAPGAILDTFPCGVNVFLLSFYWVLIVSGTLEGRLDFLPTVYWEIKTNNTVKTKRYFIDNLRHPKRPIRKHCFFYAHGRASRLTVSKNGCGGKMIKSVGWGKVYESAALTRHLPIVCVRVTADSLHHTHGRDKRGFGYFSTRF